MAKELKEIKEPEESKEVEHKFVVKEVPTQTEKVFYDTETEEVYDLTSFMARMANDISLIKKQLVGK